MVTKTKSLADELFPIEAEEELAIVDIPPEKRRLHTETYDFSIATIVDYLKNGDIFLPKFQRSYVWNRSQASRLIESLIIQCPIPVIYLNQEKDERLAIIDGNQRVTSIDLYLKDEFPLSGLTAYPELSGCYYSDLDPRFKRHITNRTLRCISILKETHPQIKIDIFERINTGAVQLNPQEIRHGVYHGALMRLIDELSAEKVWRKISGHKQDNRMKGSELILRYFSLLENMSNYRKPLKRFIDDYCDGNKDIDDRKILRLKNTFLTTIEKIDSVFGDKAFRIIDRDLKPTRGAVNAALFDAVMIGFTKLDVNMLPKTQQQKSKFLKGYHALLNEDKFRESITSGTSATNLVRYRLRRFRAFIKESL